MPTPDFSHNNTGPTAVTVPTMAGTGSAPTGVDAPDFAGDGDAPDAVAVASKAGTASAPDGVTPASFAGTGTGATGVALAGLTPTDTGPTAKTAPIGGAGTASVPQQVAASTALQPITDSNMHTATLNFFGRVKVGQLFGFYQAPAPGKVVGIQLASQVKPVGDDLIAELTDADGTSLARSATLLDGEGTAQVTFETPLPFLAGAVIRGKPLQVGTGTPGSYLTMTLIIQLD